VADMDDSTPAVWDPAAREGAGGWVRRREPARPSVPEPAPERPPWPGPTPGWTPAGEQTEQPHDATAAATDGVANPDVNGVGGVGGVGGVDREEPTALLPRVPEPTPAEGDLRYPAGGPLAGLPLFRPDPAAPAAETQPMPQQRASTAPPPPGYPPAGASSGYPQPGYQQPDYAPPAYPYPQSAPAEAAEAAGAPERRLSTPLLVLAVIVAAALLGGLAVWGLGLGSSSKHTAARGATPKVGASAGGSTAPGSGGTSGSGPGSGSAAPSGSASAGAGGGQAEASAVDQLLAQSSSSRQQVIDAVAAVAQCTSPAAVAAAQTTLTQAATARQALVTQLGGLSMAQVPGGAAAVQVLSKAWTESAAADTDYAAWAGDLADGGCTAGNAPQNSDFENGGTQSGLATTDKNTFIDLWTPIAMQYGLPTRTADAI
jgi:hypothetical protein